MAPLISDETLRKRIAAVKPIRIRGTFFRTVLAKYRDAILSTAGSLQHGGRYNPKREFGPLYLSESEQVCKAEVLRTVDAPASFEEPRVCGRIHAALEKVLDLTDEQVLEELGIRRDELLQNTGDRERDYRLTRRIARLARALGFEALKTPSVTSQGDNLIIFMENLSPKAKVELLETRPMTL